MNEATDYVHTHVVNYEPTYLVLSEAVERYRNGAYDDVAELRNAVAESVDQNWQAMGLDATDVNDDDVDFVAMIEFEAGE